MDGTMDRSIDPHDEFARAALGTTSPESTLQQPLRTLPSSWRWMMGSRYVWAFAAVVLTLAATLFALKRSESPDLRPDAVALSSLESGRAATELRQEAASIGSNLENAPAPAPAEEESDTSERKAAIGSMIAQTGSMTIVPANYDRTAGSIDALVAARGGYVQKLNSESRPDASRQVSFTLRIPVKQMDAFLADLRKLGRVEEESRENEEVTDQYVDLDARLQSARAGEGRLIQLLQTRAGKLEDVLDAERELTRVHGEVESMTGERNLLVHRVEYATIELHLQEEYRAQLGSGVSAGSLHNALAEGLQNLEAGAIAALAFVLAYGPSILFWLAIFSIPAWMAWRVASRRFAPPR